MAQNLFKLNVDIKNRFTSDVPTFRQGDTAVIIFKVFDNGLEYELTAIDKAKVHILTQQGNSIELDCTFITSDGKKAIRCELDKVSMAEKGLHSLTLIMYDGDTVLSIQPFTICIFNNGDGTDSFIDLIRDMIEIIENLKMDLSQTIKLSEKGQPNGVATLDKNGKIPLPQMPKEFQGYLDHIPQTVFEHMVHGMRITDDGIMQYLTPNGWQNVGFAPDATGNGGSGNHVLNATVTVNSGIATVLYSGVPTVVSQKWDVGNKALAYFTLNGKSFNGNQFNVSQIGLHTLWYKDSNGNSYVVLFEVTTEMLQQPNISVNVVDGLVTVSVDQPASIKKWAKGEHNVTYFQYNGIVFTGNTFNVNEIGKYTIYVKLDNGSEYVYVFEVTANMLLIPRISISVNLGVATVVHSPSIPLAESRYGQGNLSLTQARGGTIYTNSKFNVTATGYYTVYHKYTNGIETIKAFNVSSSMLPDTTPPTTITNFTGTSSTDGKSISLSWTNPIDLDFNKAVIRFKTGSYPTSINDGQLAYEGAGTISTVPNLTPSTTYYFRAFTVDTTGNVNSSTSSQQTTVTTQVPVLTTVPVSLAETSGSSSLDGKYRALRLTIKNCKRIEVIGGDYNSNTSSNYTQQNYYKNYNLLTTRTYFDITKTDGTAMIKAYDFSDSLIHNMQWKSTPNYNYIIVDNAYIILERIKTTQTVVTIPTVIDDLPVKDIGAVFYRYDDVYDNYTVTDVIVPIEIISSGAFCHDTLLRIPQKRIKNVTIYNPDFEIINRFGLYQETVGYTIRVPANSAIYNQIINNINLYNTTKIETF